MAHTHEPPDAPRFNPNFSAEEEMEAGRSTRGFAYVAVGIMFVSLILALGLMAGAVYLFFHAL